MQVESSLYLWDEADLILIDDPDLFLKFFVHILLRIFMPMFIKENVLFLLFLHTKSALVI